MVGKELVESVKIAPAQAASQCVHASIGRVNSLKPIPTPILILGVHSYLAVTSQA